jgi:TonB family protein
VSSQKTLGALAMGACLLFATAARAQEEAPLQAGSEGVPVPKRTKTVPPEYPAEAQAAGVRGIVILELVVDPQGKVASVNVLRSVAGLDEAAVEAAKQWEYEITKVGGKPVSVRLTVPITFAMRLPEMSKDNGIPELRQGVAPPFPAGEKGGADVSAEVTIDSEGQITEAQILRGESPFSDSVIRALRTWRFASPGDNVTMSFRVQIEFIPARGTSAPRVTLRLDQMRRTEGMASAPPAPLPPAAASKAPPSPAPPPTTVAAAPSPPPTTVAQAPPPPTPNAPAATPPPPTTVAPQAKPSPAPASPAPTPAPTPAVASPRPSPSASPAVPPPPPVEVVSAPQAPEPPETGASAIRDVSLAESGVPDLAKGRRPLVPPFARMTGTKGTVEVAFSVGASGTTSVQDVKGPDLLRAAAEQTVISWVFRRSKADRLHLLAVFTYDGDKATASVKPQPAPETGTP